MGRARWDAEIDIDADCYSCAPESADRLYSDSSVFPVAADGRRGDGVTIENDAIRQIDCGNSTDALSHILFCVLQISGLKINISCGSPCGECGEKHSAFENKILTIDGRSESGEERLEHIKGQEVLRIAARPTRDSLDS